MAVVRAVWSLVVLAACATAGDPARPPDAPTGGGDDSGGGGSAQACPAGQLATNVGSAREVSCAAIELSTQKALDERCSVYLGARDNCDGCAAEPAKWGRASGPSCANGLGADSNCTTPTLGGPVVQAFGLNLDGDVNGDDKIYAGLHCATVTGADAPAPCKPGEYIDGYDGTRWTCTPLSVAVVDYVRSSCSLYLGWQDTCGGCALPPVKWGYAGDHGCTTGAGADDTCTTALLGGESVPLIGINTDGDVNDDDKLHLALHCATPAPATATATAGCPPGQFVTGTGATDFTCSSPALAIAKYVAAHCTIYFGWRDQCDGCVDPPGKWGSVRVGACTNGAGVDNTCSKLTLGGQSLDMFGLNPDGDVDGNDVLYIGLQCK